MNENEREDEKPTEATSEEVLTPASVLDKKTCPHCNRKLLTLTSILCNWCGEKIDDDAYLAHAAQNRLTHDSQIKAQVEAFAQEESKYGVFGRLKRRGNTPPKKDMPPT